MRNIANHSKVMVFGVFAVLHPGHLYFFRQAKKHGDFLIAVVARDVTVKKIKGVYPKLNEKSRLQMVDALKIVDKAVLGHKVHHCKVILKHKPDVICLGYDQKVSPHLGKQLEKTKVKIVRLRAYKPYLYKSSILLNS